MKNIIILISLILLLIIVNVAYFEHSVTKNPSTLFLILSSWVTILIDLFSLAKIAKVISRMLKLN
jgi:hypothetical protein